MCTPSSAPVTRSAWWSKCVWGVVFAPLWFSSTAHAGAWTVPEGVLWTKVAWFRLNSDRLFVDSVREGVFCAEENRTLLEGDRGPYDCNLAGGGGLRTDQLFIEAAIGIHRRIDFRLQVPVILAAEFVSDGTPATRRGLGDIRATTQVLIVDHPVVISANMEVKFPTGFFTPDAVGAPLGEGQWDFAFRALISGSLLGGKLWMGAEVGYRVRMPNDELGFSGNGLNLGDEILAVAEGGGRPVPWMYLSLRSDLLYGFESTDGPFTLAGRRILYVQPGITVYPFTRVEHWEDLGVEFGARIPVWGRGWPADPIYFVGMSKSVRLFEAYSGT